ncbi:hypothetical protein COP1_025397 [Malus domestica]
MKNDEYDDVLEPPINFSMVEDEENLEFLQSHNIRLLQFGIKGKTEPSVSILKDTILEALKILIDGRNHPVLIHCKRGKVREVLVLGGGQLGRMLLRSLKLQLR